jgi:dTDP-4-amino-4,6-dideoxygalactose transaminase
MSKLDTIPFVLPAQAPSAQRYMEAALSSGFVEGDGPFTKKAAALLQRWVGSSPVLLTTSCTHALELAALVLGLGPSDEIVMPSFTFVSTANAFALRGAKIRFADIDAGTFSMGLAELEAAITPRTTAVAVVHYGGVARDLDQLQAFCVARKLRLIEDNAHGLFGTSKGRALGSFGVMSALSFHKTKNVTCGEGGALVLNDASLLERAEIIREKGTDRSRFLRGQIDKYTWREIGSSYLPSDILAAMLCAQLENAEETQRRRLSIWARYDALLRPQAEKLGVALQAIPEGLAHPAHLFAVLVPDRVDRARVLSRLKEVGVHATSHYEPLHLSPCASDHRPLPVTERVASRLVRLPLHPNLTNAQVDYVVDALLSTIAQELRAVRAERSSEA